MYPAGGWIKQLAYADLRAPGRRRVGRFQHADQKARDLPGLGCLGARQVTFVGDVVDVQCGRCRGSDQDQRGHGHTASVPTQEHAGAVRCVRVSRSRSEEHTSELQSLMRISYAVFCLKKKKTKT